MSRRDDLNPARDAALAGALRALPDSKPEPDLWPGLARAIAHRRRPRRAQIALPFAIAAAVALALVLPRVAQRAPESRPSTSVATHATPNSTRSSDDREVAGLKERSRLLERWIAAVASRAPQDGRDLMAAVEVEDLIGLVDVQLGGADSDAEALPLWRQRVALLEDLAAIRSSAFAVAENDTTGEAMPTSLDTIN